MKLSPLRAAARIAWRQARRAPWRSVLIVTTVALPIAGLTTAAVVIRTALPTTQERIVDLFGTSDIIVEQARDLSPEDLARVLPAGTTIVQRRFVSTENIVGGSRIYTWFEEYSVPIDRAPVSGMFEIMSGRAPTAAGEAAVAPEVLTAFHAEIGDEITFDDVGLTVRVVGTTVDPEQMGEPVGALGPGTLASLSRRTEDGYLIDLPASASLSASIEALQKDGQLDGGYEDPSLVMQDYASEGSVATRGTFAATALLLLGTALIAGAAFAVGAQRQLRTLGLIGAAGGEPRHVRTTVLFGGVSLGVLGSLVGVGVGVLGAYALHPYLDRLANRIVGPVAIPFIPLLGAVALGTSAATLAAYGPARAAARLSTLEALAGRTRPPRAPGKIAGLGLIALAVGGVVTTVGTRSSSDPWLAIGLVVMILGFLAAIPLMVSAVGKQAGRLPTIPRLATRDIARNGRRTAAALAAATIVLALPVSVSALTLSDEAAEHRIPPMAADNLGIESLGRTGSAWQDRAQALAEDLRIAFPNALVAPYRPAVKVVPRDGHEKERSVTVFGPEETATQGGTRYSYLTWGQLVIGDADLLRAFHAEDGIQALNEGKIVGIGPGMVLDGTVRITTHPGGEDPDPGIFVQAVEAGGAAYWALGSGTDYIVSAERASELGYQPSSKPAGNSRFIFRSETALSDEEIQRAKSIAALHPGAVVTSVDDVFRSSLPLRLGFEAAGAAIALIIVGVIVALVATESRRDRAILVAVGAEPRVRRAVAGASAGVVAILSGLLAIPMGFVPAALFRIAQRSGHPVVVPWATIAFVVVVVPMIAGIAGALLSRQPRAARLLRPIA